MKKLFIIFAIIFGILIIILGVLFYYLSDQKSEEKINLVGQNSQEISVNDFKKISNNYSNVSVLPSGDNFYIQYDQITNTFSITFSVSSVREGVQARVTAEERFISQLGVSKVDACKLQVVEEFFQAEQIGLPTEKFPLSFCPGGDLFPSVDSNNQIR